jgi:hypothetical protein
MRVTPTVGHNRRFRDLNDAARYGANFALICRACRREVIIERRSFIEMMHAIGAGRDPQAIGSRLRCTACHHRGGIVELAPPETPHLKLDDGDTLPPKGISLTTWLKMSNGERRRYRRALR